MADEGTLSLSHTYEDSGEDLSKAELQRRLDETRDSISQTVTEIKDTVVHQYEAVKETISDSLDWREQFRKRPVAWSLGATGGGLVLGYTIAGLVKSNSGRNIGDYRYAPARSQAYAAESIVGEAAHSGLGGLGVSQSSRHKQNNRESGPGLLERFQETEAYDHIRKEAGAVGRRFVGELSQTAQEVLLPAAISWLKQWLSSQGPETRTSTDAGKEARRQEDGLNYQPVLERIDD